MQKNRISVRICSEPIALNKTAAWQSELTHGAANIFVGSVRSINLGRQVTSVFYDCHIPLCLKILNQISVEAQSKWGEDVEILVEHRHGSVTVGEPSVLVMATARHRDESYRVTRYIIEEIKTRAPIWKKEFYLDGESEWVRGHALCQHRKVDHHDIDGSRTCGR